MKKYLIIIFLLLAAAADADSPKSEDVVSWDPTLRRIPIERQVDGSRTNRTPHFAFIREFKDPEILPDIWVPGELLKQMSVPLELDGKKTSYSLKIDKPAELLSVTALRAFAPGTLELSLNARSEDNIQHVNLNGIEIVTGLKHYIAPNDVLIVGRSETMQKYTLPEHTKYELPDMKSPLNLVWDHIVRHNPDLTSEDVIPAIDVLSPTWFALADESGRVSNRADISYVKAAHKLGYRVWGLVSNGFKREMTRDFLADSNAQNRFIAQLLAYSALYGLDGINIDFENVRNEDADRLTSFVRKLASAAETLGLTMSIDVMIPTKWSTVYQRKKLASLVDYVAVMTYDEHWRTSPKAGSTASMPWVKAGLERTLEEVPAEKLLLGIPLYTREWEVRTDAKGKSSLKSRALGMVSVDMRLEDSESEMTWLETIGQHYFEYKSDDALYKIWVEDERSIALRMELVKDKKLAGAAFWRKGFEKPEIWDVVLESFE